MKDIIDRIAEQNSTTSEDVRKEMRKAIAAMPKEKLAKIPCAGSTPNEEEVIQYLYNEIMKTQLN